MARPSLTAPTLARPRSEEPEVTPAGLGVAVVFLWALAVQLTAQGIAGLFGGLGHHHGVGGPLQRLVLAALLLAIGEGLRRGMEWARWTMIALAVLVTLLGWRRPSPSPPTGCPRGGCSRC